MKKSKNKSTIKKIMEQIKKLIVGPKSKKVKKSAKAKK